MHSRARASAFSSSTTTHRTGPAGSPTGSPASSTTSTFFTASEKEVRAWTFHEGDTAPVAAGTIHTDFERGFIKAEVCRWEDLVKFGSEVALRDKGLLRIEGKDYVVKDGDVMHFRFNV